MPQVTYGASPPQSQLMSLLEHYQTGRFEAAEQLAKSLTEQYPYHQLSWKVLAVVLKQSGRKAEALSANRKAVELDPHDAEACYNMGNTLQDLFRLEEARASYLQAIRLKPDYAKAYSDLGNTLKKLGRLEEAETSYRQATTLNPNFAGAHYNLGITLQELNELEKAEASYRQAIKLKPDYAQAYNNLGVTLKALRRLDEAEASYRRAIALNPGFAEAHNNLAIMLKELGRPEEAEAGFNRAIALNPDYTDAFMNRGQLLFDKGEFEAALRDFEICNTEDSRAAALTCLYMLERVEEIYKRIEMQSKLDDTNIKVAAIATLVADQFKKETAHNFCKNPLDFIYHANISSHVEDPDSYISDVIKELLAIKPTWEPANQSINKGFQSHYNFLENPSGVLASLKSIIIEELDAYRLKFNNESCSYIQKWPSGNNLSGWYVILKQQGFHYPHIHPSGWLSGVVYLQVVPSADRNEGAIEFCLGADRYSDANASKVTYIPRAGDIVFFPSSLHHRTVPFTADSDRIVVAFDLCPDG
ncbi:MAG: tetratricopeptide repeat protein [Gammaproteobacteria bacterium]|nr:tetratricopeptide repeat protein [Pseudomonadales bacterium]MCP5346132.1 tetratricopeptide repeat protein [Pseudomonadales bacterium]